MNRWLDTIMRDVRFAIRTLRKNSGFSITVVLTLAIGIGANTAVFSLIDAVILRPLPVERPQALALLSPAPDSYFSGSSSGDHALSYPEYRELRGKTDVFQNALCRFRFVANARSKGETERIIAEMVSGSYFETLGVKAALGRTITDEDDGKPGAHPVAVLSYDYWMKSLGGNRDVVGQTITVNGQLLTVIGVSAEGFDGVELDFNPAVRVPISMAGRLVPYMPWISLDHPYAAFSRWVQVIGRLRPGITPEKAEAAVQAIHHAHDDMLGGRLNEEDRRRLRAARLEVLPGAAGISQMRRDWTTPLTALMVMVALVLALTCVNVANLHLARGMQREPELAVRMALGAGRRRVVTRLVIESLLLALLGGAVGIALASSVARLVVPFMATPEGPANVIPQIDWRVFGFGLLITTAAALAFGLAPALMSTRISLAPALRRSSSTGSAGGRIRRVLVTAQVSLSLILMIGSALFMRSLDQLYRVDPGVDTETVVAFGVDPVLNGYPRDRVEEFYTRLQSRLENLPGVQSVGMGMVRVLGTDQWTSSFALKGDPASGSGGSTFANLNVISSGYFRTLGIGLLSGREFAPSDRRSSLPVVIVNRAFSTKFFHRTNTVGETFALPGPTGTENVQIVGVVEDAKYDTLKQATPPQIFIPSSQFFTMFGMTCYVRFKGQASQLFPSIREAVRQTDPTAPAYAMCSLEDQVKKSLSLDRCVASVATSFAIVATLLANVGLYGLLSFSVARRTRELGLRVALGAGRGNVIGLVLKEACLLWFIGTVIGVAAALGFGRLIANLLHGVTPHDPWVIAAATALLTATTVIAAALPARRAVKVDPIEALRCE